MSDQHPVRTARRNALRRDRLGDKPFCLFCGYACLESLTTVSRKWLEAKGVPKDWIDRLLATSPTRRAEDINAFSRQQDCRLL